MKWEPFFFDSNAVFGEIESAVDWCHVCERIAEDWHLSYEEAVETVMNEAMMAPIASIPPEYKPDPASTTLPGKLGTVPTSIPSFGFRREHLDGTIALVGWATAHGMDLRRAAGLEMKESP